MKARKGFHAIVSCAMAAVAAGVPAAQPSTSVESDRAQIVALEQRWLNAIRNGDRHSLETILADDFIDINTNGQMRDRTEAISRAAAPPGSMQTITQLRVRVHGDTAIANGINTVHSQAQGWTVEVAFTDVFVRERGTWRAASAQETVRKPPAVSASTH